MRDRREGGEEGGREREGEREGERVRREGVEREREQHAE